MKENIPSIAIDIANIPIGSLSKFKTKQLYEYLIEANKKLDEAKKLKQWLHSAIALKYDPHVEAKRRRLENYIDIIHIDEPDFKISCEVPKKVEWRQDILGRLLAGFIARGGNIPDYALVTYYIPDEKYDNLPQEIKYKFNAARIIKFGNPVYKITPIIKRGYYE